MVKALFMATVVAVSCATALPVRARPLRLADPPAKSQTSLADFLAKLAWDPVASGPLLIVSPEDTVAVGAETAIAQAGDAEEPRPEAPVLNAAGSYKPAAVAAWFDRRIVPVGSLTVFAPRTMTVLNYKNLPRPDAWTGLSAPTKLRLLESTFTDAQWAESTSDAGIGAEDMTGTQREVYLSLLPDPLYVAPIDPANAAGSTLTTPTVLSPDQRIATRLQLQKRLTVDFQQNERSRMLSNGENSTIVAFGYTLRIASSASYPDSDDTLGVELRNVVPNKPKPTQLPADWPPLDRLIDPAPAKTVGELIARIARLTGAHLYCDPRYAARSVYFRGSPVRAGDLLSGLCWTLTATWRRLNDSFVLTDDLAGLGVRHAQIEEWIQQKNIVAKLRDAQIEKVLAAKAYTSLTWSSTDPSEPGPDLMRKLDDFYARPPVPLPGNGPIDQYAFVPVADLPEAKRTQFQTEYDQHFRNAPAFGISGVNAAVGVHMQASYVVPGLGRMAASEVPWFFSNQDMLARRYILDKPPHTTDEQKTAGLFHKIANRALLVEPADVPALLVLAKEARLRGFTQLWITVPPSDLDLISAGARAGKENGLEVHAVVRIMRAAPNTPPENLGVNILGETTTQYLRRRMQQTHESLARFRLSTLQADASDKKVLQDSVGDSVPEPDLRRGDFRQDTEAGRLKFAAYLRQVVALPEVAGVVLEESAPPGFGALHRRGEGYTMTDPLREMGYDVATRLACLSKLGFDPIDISPLPGGDEGIGIALPFFRDYAHGFAFGSQYERQISSPGGESLWPLWCSFRHDLSLATFHAAVAAANSKRPGISLMKPLLDNAPPMRVNWFARIDASNPDRIGSTSRGSAAESGNRIASNREVARAESVTSYYPCVLGGYDVRGTRSREQMFEDLNSQLAAAAAWDGVVIDVTNATDAEVPDVLKLFPEVVGRPYAPAKEAGAK